MIEIRHLRVLREIARAGSYSAAARSLGYTQPAMSQQMRALEKTVGAKLVVQTGRTLSLTEAGSVLLLHANSILTSIKAAEEEVGWIAGLQASRVRLTAFPSGTAALIPPAIARATQTHAGLQVSLTEAEPPDSLKSLQSGECDITLAFTYEDYEKLPSFAAGMHRIPLLDDRLVALLPDTHPLAKRETIRVEDLADDSWIAGCPRCSHSITLVCGEAEFEPRITYTTDDQAALQSLVAAGLGVSLVPGLVLESIKTDGIVARPLTREVVRSVYAVTWPDLKRVPAVRAVLDALTASAISIRERSPFVA